MQTVPPVSRKALLTAHVVSSVGWIGAVAAFLALNVVGLTTEDPALSRGMFRAMNVTGLYVIVPASLLSVLTGVLQGMWTPWGLWRHRWVATKLVVGLLATLALLLHQFTAVREAARRAELGVEVGGVGAQLVADASVAIAILVFATILSIYKPWGLTRHGQRLRDSVAEPAGMSWSRKLVIAIAILAVGAFVTLHLAGGGMKH
jgi:hypothetical protein